jgi:hypothetical protein
MESHNNLRTLYKIGGVAALLQLATVLGLIVISFTLGSRPTGVQEFFDLYQQNKLVGLLRDDFTSLILIVLYMGTYPALFYALRRVNFAWATLATIFTFVAVAICASTQASFSLMHLSDLYAAAATEAQRALYLAAGEAVLASDMWNSSGSYLSGILLQGGGVIISLVMLRSKQFSKVTIISGLLGNGLDLVQHLLHPFAPSVSASIQMVMGPFYMVWFPMLARDLFRTKE